MQNSDHFQNRNLAEISILIDNLLKNSTENQFQLNEIETWLSFHFKRLHLQRNKSNWVTIRQPENQQIKDDAMFIFDSSLRIISYSGVGTFSSDLTIEGQGNRFLYDLVDLTEHQKLVSTFETAKKENRNIQTEFHFIRNINTLYPGVLEIDMNCSNHMNDRYVAHLKYTDKLDDQLREYQSAVLENLPGIDIYLFDRNYRYLFSVGKEKEKYGLTSFDYIGKSMFEVMDKKTIRSVYPFYNKALKGEMNEGEIRYRDDIYSIIAIPVKDYHNNIVAGILISQNVTSDKLLEEELKNGKEEAQKADKYKSIFIANMSHEIRSPLNTIIGFSEQIEKTKLTREQSKYFSFIKKASEHLLHLVNEVVFLFKIGMGKVFIEDMPFSLNELLEELENIFSIQAREKKINFEFEKEPNTPDALVGDPYRLRQVLTNLLVNAIKYTDRGKVSLRCALKKDLNDEIILIFEVKDTGIGISKKDLPKIFKVFEQGHSNFKNHKGGAGLGLGICKELITLLNGDIEVESKLKEGSVFTVTLPFRKVSNELILSKIKKFSIEDQFLSGKKILLADDDEHHLILMNKIFKDWNTDFLLAKNGRIAFKELNKTKFDIILLDIQMPRMSGIEIVREIRSNKNGINQNTPILFVTANAIKSDIIEYLEEGFNDYIIKPYREIELYNKFCNILGFEPVVLKPKTQINAGLTDEPSDNFNTSELWETATGDQTFFRNMITNFISNAGDLDRVLNHKVSSKNWKEVGMKVHKTIPTFKYFRLYKLAASLEKIEDYTLRIKDFRLANKEIDEIGIKIKDIVKQAKSILEH